MANNMRYLNERNINEIGISWKKTVDVIENSVKSIAKGEFAQPIKPYLQYGNVHNRIIAMPAYIGGESDMAGIKWISSFPDNSKIGLPRAHSVMILNDAETGEPMAVINTALLSIIRTVSVSGLMIRYYDKARNFNNINIGIIGFGPIGQYHLKMCIAIYGNKINKIYIYDLNPIDKESIDILDKHKIEITKSWQDAYKDADIFITCTVSKSPYINSIPKKGSLQLNVSLRDYTTDIFDYIKNGVIVDNWEEVCRANTDIENFHIINGLKKEQTKSILDVVCGNCMEEYDESEVIMFNPMGMATFDIGIGSYYLKKAEENGIGHKLED